MTARPLNGMVNNWPIGNANKILPNPASLRWSDVFISGIRLAQLAKDNPWQKKKTDTAVRTCSLLNGAVIVPAVDKIQYNRKNNLIHSGNG